MTGTGAEFVVVGVSAKTVRASHVGIIQDAIGLSNTIFVRETKYMASQEVFILIDADRISPAVERAVRTNNPERIANMSQDIERGDRLLRSWLEDHGGRVLLFHGDEIYASLPGEHLADLGTLHSELQECWNDSITIGVGLNLNEAKKALDAGKKRGGSRIVFYAPEIESMVGDEESASESHDAKTPSPDPDELKELSKSNTPSGMGVHAAKHQSLQNDVETGPASPQPELTPYGAPQASASGETPITPSATNMAAGLPSAAGPGPSAVEEQFHTAAAGTEAEAARAEGQANAAQPVDEGVEKIKAVIVRILQKVKAQAPVLEQLKEQAPEAYQAVVGAIQAMLMMAKALVPQQAQQQEAQAQEQGAEPPKEEGAKEEPTQKSEEDFGEPLEKGQSELRAVRSMILNDTATKEQLDEAIKTIMANRGQFSNEDLKDLGSHPNFHADHARALLESAMRKYNTSRDYRDGNNMEEMLDQKQITPAMAFEVADAVDKDGPKKRGQMSLGEYTARHLIANSSKRFSREEALSAWDRAKSTDYRREIVTRPDVPAELVNKASKMPNLAPHVAGHHLLDPKQHAKQLKGAIRELTKLRGEGAHREWDYDVKRRKHDAVRQKLKNLLMSPNISAQDAEKIAAETLNHPDYGSSLKINRDVDAAHSTNEDVFKMTVKPGLHKIRQLRDQIEGQGGEVQPNTLGGGKNVLQNIGRLPNGNYSSKKIQEHLDSLPGIPVWASHGTWPGAQRHSKDTSNVFRVSLPTELTEKLLQRGVNTKQGHSSGHPGDPVSGLGWVRWTGNDRGVHIDEIQHDFDLPQQKIIEETLGHPINRFLHEAFHEWVRSHGDQKPFGVSKKNPAPVIGTPVHIWQPESKAPLSGLNTDQKLPGHFYNTYRQTPEKMGYQQGTYGTIPTQSTKDLKGKPTYHDVFRKSVKEIRESAMKKSYVMADPLTPKSTGIDNQVKVNSDDFYEEHNKVEVEPNEKVPSGSKLSKIRKAAMKKALPMPEEGNKRPPTPSGALAIRMEGDAAPQSHKFRHIQPGEAAHVSMDGKPQGEIAIRQYQSGMTMPNENVGEGQTGIIHPTSALDPQDGRAKQGPK